jgi:hypothetical protein
VAEPTVQVHGEVLVLRIHRHHGDKVQVRHQVAQCIPEQKPFPVFRLFHIGAQEGFAHHKGGNPMKADLPHPQRLLRSLPFRRTPGAGLFAPGEMNGRGPVEEDRIQYPEEGTSCRFLSFCSIWTER